MVGHQQYQIMKWKNVYDFLKDNGVPNAVLNDFSSYFEKFNKDNVKLLVIENCIYLWSINNKIVFCDIDQVNDDIKVFRNKLKDKLQRHNLEMFFNNRVNHSVNELTIIFGNEDIFNPQKLSDNELDEKFTTFVEHLETNILERFKNETIGKTICELESFVVVIRHVFYRYYKQISILNDDEMLNKKMVGIKHAKNLKCYCTDMLEYINNTIKNNNLKVLLITLMSFIIKLCEYCPNTIDVFKKTVLLMVTYSPRTRKRKLSRRPKVRKMPRLSWREKRPPRIKTDLPVSMPDVANKARHKRLDNKTDDCPKVKHF